MSLLIDAGMDAPLRLRQLQARVGWICQLGRILAAGYALWTLWLVVSFWTNSALVERRFAMVAGIEPHTVSGIVRSGGFALSAATWLAVALTCWTAWRLFSAYLKGRIFTPESAGLLRQTTLYGIAALLFDISIRPFMVWLVAGSAPSFANASYYYFSPNDLALLIFLIALFAIAHIFKVAAELASENAEIL
jgi:hypothetical protein